MLKIIAHRGGAGFALENSATAFKKCVGFGIPIVELDVRLTKDNELVVNHDSSLRRTAGDSRAIRRHTWRELSDVRLNDGSPLLRLQDALSVLGDHCEVMIELKDKDSQNALLKTLKSFPKVRVIVVSFRHKELVRLKQMAPKLACYPLAIFWPGEAVRFASKHHLGGIGLPFWTLNPLVYWHLKRARLNAYTYTTSNRWLIRFIHRFYPNVAICTNRPDKFA